MNIKSTKILLGILHICILGICVLTIYSNQPSENAVTHVTSSSTQVVVSPTENETETTPAAEPGSETAPEVETDAEAEINTETGSEAETNTETDAETEANAEPEAETVPAYSFRSLGTVASVNIRNAPSLDGRIIGKIPIGGEGIVLELVDDMWAFIEYDEITGYCSREWIELQEIEQ